MMLNPPNTQMTLRDTFAGAALETLIGFAPNPHARRRLLAQQAYEFADAMLEARLPNSDKAFIAPLEPPICTCGELFRKQVPDDVHSWTCPMFYAKA
jgi:hypothetical protein